MILTALLFVYNITHFLDLYIETRQKKKLLDPAMPAEIIPFVTRETFNRSRNYSHEKLILGMKQSSMEYLIFNTVIFTNFIGLVWSISKSISNTILSNGSNSSEPTSISGEIIASIFFFVIEGVPSFVAGIPFSLYSIFSIEQRYGFNRQTISTFILDTIKGVFVSTTILSTILSVIVPVFRYFVNRISVIKLFLVLWGIMILFQIIMIIVTQEWILPLFNKFSPLEDQELKDKIEKVCKDVNFPLGNIYVMDGSKRSNHSNAFFIGIFKSKTIVIYDTLLEKLTHDEILAVISHELGHWYKLHIIKMLTATQVYTASSFLFFLALSKNKSLYQSFGVSEEMPFIVGMMVAGFLYTPLSFLLTFLFNFISRKNEFEADAFAVTLDCGESLKQALIKLHVDNLGNMCPDVLYSLYKYSHPPLVERLDQISAEIKKNE
eukprot:GHVP01048335.1.p1 GENE.GHVP01048335.1~~GHVP01048335.1.p1  ORF type:complete len:436 (+),score=52.22 GHVP01048335.1:606-1913(+)